MTAIEKPPVLFYPIAVLAMVWFAALLCMVLWQTRTFQFEIEGRLLDCLVQLGSTGQLAFKIGVWAGVLGALLFLRRSILAPLAWGMSFLGLLTVMLGLWTQNKLVGFLMPETFVISATFALSFVYYFFSRSVMVRHHLI